MQNFVPITDISLIPAAAGLAVPFSRTTVALFRTGDAVHAVDDACPRCGASLAAGTLDESRALCARCGWSIDVTTGCSVGLPALRVDRYAVKLVGSTVLVAYELAAPCG